MDESDNIPAVRYLTAYTPDDPHPLKTFWVAHNCPDVAIFGRVPPEDLIPLGTHVVGSACAHEGTCSDHDRKLLAEHVVGREDTDDA